MVKQVHNKGYTLVEMLVVVCIISIFVRMIYASYPKQFDQEAYLFFDDYLYKQTEALLKHEQIFVNDSVWFNDAGNINQARTIQFDNGKTFVIELGGGRLVPKE